MDETVDDVVGGCKFPGQCSAGDAGFCPRRRWCHAGVSIAVVTTEIGLRGYQSIRSADDLLYSIVYFLLKLVDIAALRYIPNHRHHINLYASRSECLVVTPKIHLGESIERISRESLLISHHDDDNLFGFTFIVVWAVACLNNLSLQGCLGFVSIRKNFGLNKRLSE